MRNMTTTYVYLILDSSDEDVLEAWGSKKRAISRCYQLAGREADYPWLLPSAQGDHGSVPSAGDPYQVFTWVKMTVKR